MTIRLCFWLTALDVARALRLPHGWYLWIVGRASDATDWSSGYDNGGPPPW